MTKTSNLDYWRERERENLKKYLKKDAEYSKELDSIYHDMLRECQKDIDAFYGRYATKEGISIEEAMKRVSKLDIEEYSKKAEKYVKNKDLSKVANEEMRLYNLTMKVNRLEMLKAQIGMEMINGFDEIEKMFGQALDDRTIEEFKRQAGILGDTLLANVKDVSHIVNASFHHATFSDRTWMNQDLLRLELAKQLKTGLIQGRNPRELARFIEKAFNTSRFNSERLMRTELARVQVGAQQEAYIRNGIEKYTFIDAEDFKVCGTCKEIHGRHYLVKNMQPGLNAPPMHPNCRCSTVAFIPEGDYNKWLNGYKDHGMSFAEWRDNRPKSKKKVKDSDDNGKIEIEDIPELAGVKQGDPMTFEEADSFRTNPKYGSEHGYSVNCQTCVVAFEARQRGFNVTARPNTRGSACEAVSLNTNLPWIDPKTKTHPEYILDRTATTANKYLEFVDQTVEQGNRYTIQFGWKGRGRSGHIINLDRNDDGELRLKDNQRGKDEEHEWIGRTAVLRYLKQMKYVTSIYGTKFPCVPKILRIDNLDFNKDIADKILEGGADE